LFKPIAAAAAAIALVVFIAPPMQKKASKTAAGPRTSVDQKVASATAQMDIDSQGRLEIQTVNADTGQTRTTGVYPEASVSLAELMIQQSVVPTVRGWDHLQLNNRALQELGRMVLLRSINGLNHSVEGEELIPASPAPVGPEAPLEPAIEPFNVEREADEFLPL
jgi:hypothetical protein